PRRRETPSRHAERDEPASSEPVAERTEDRARHEVTDHDGLDDETELEVGKAELFLELRADGADEGSIEVVDEVQAREQCENDVRAFDSHADGADSTRRPLTDGHKNANRRTTLR